MFPPVRAVRRIATVAGVLLAACVLPASAKNGGGDAGAAYVTTIRATLIAEVSGDGTPFTWHFDYGTTTDYGRQTPEVEDPGSTEDRELRATVTGLAPGTRYYARLASTAGGVTTYGEPFSFTTPDDPQPELGRSAVTKVLSGSVRVRVPASRTSARLAPTARIPVGSVLDTRHGTVAVTTALPGRATQTATFHGGAFGVLQKRKLRGRTDIVLHPAALRTCPATGGARSASRRRPPPELGHLWGSDRNGNYRTHGHNSVATVRGTTWLTVERCDGTLTEVRKGAVSVFDRRLHRRVLVRAGGRYLARRG